MCTASLQASHCERTSYTQNMKRLVQRYAIYDTAIILINILAIPATQQQSERDGNTLVLQAQEVGSLGQIE